MNLRSLFVAAALGAAACSAQNVQDRWDRFVADHDACQDPSDCVLVWPGCPLGCYDVVSADAEQEAIDYASKLVGQYEALGRSCDYSCVPPGDLVCDAGHCGVTQ